MNRIVTDAQIAYAIEPIEQNNRLKFYQHEMQTFTELKERYINSRPWYKLKDGNLYHNGESSPITGGNVLASTIVRTFEYRQRADINKPKLLYVKIEAESDVTHHRITLTTEVFMRGLQDE